MAKYPMYVRYHPAIAPVLGAGAVFVGLSGLVTGAVHLLVIAVVNGAVAIGFAVQPWYVVKETSIEVRNLIGFTLKTHAFERLSDLEVRGSAVCRKGGEVLSGVGRSVSNRSDWEAMAAAIRQASHSGS